MKRVPSNALLLKIAAGLLAVALLAGMPQCQPRIEAKPGQFVRHTAAAPEGNRKLVVFVHGFTGDPQGTWIYSRDNVSTHWPNLVASDPALNAFDIFVASYFTSALKPGKTIHEIASDLNSDLQQHGVFDAYDNIFSIAHSMGNLVVREAMLDQTIYLSVRAPLIISFGAPSNGADIARICALFGSNQCRDLIPEDTNTWLQATNDHWHGMYRIPR